ncbi:Outer-membrane lipoprotein carrier protein [Gammaproteobacteria bacterium]
MKLVKPSIFLLLLWLVAVTEGLAAGQKPGQDIAVLSRFLSGLESFQCHFEQQTFSPSQKRVRAEGTFFLKRPNLFRWDYSQPPGQVIVADGYRVWMVDPELKQVSHESQEKALRGTPALLLSDPGALDHHFAARALDDEEGLSWVELTPKDPDSEVALMMLGFRRDQLEVLQMKDRFDQLTHMRFTNTERNPKLSARLFRYEPPPGMDLFER